MEAEPDPRGNEDEIGGPSWRCVRMTWARYCYGSPSFRLIQHPRLKSDRRSLETHFAPAGLFAHSTDLRQGIRAFDQHVAEHKFHEHPVQKIYSQPIDIPVDVCKRHIPS